MRFVCLLLVVLQAASAVGCRCGREPRRKRARKTVIGMPDAAVPVEIDQPDAGSLLPVLREKEPNNCTNDEAAQRTFGLRLIVDRVCSIWVLILDRRNKSQSRLANVPESIPGILDLGSLNQVANRASDCRWKFFQIDLAC